MYLAEIHISHIRILSINFHAGFVHELILPCSTILQCFEFLFLPALIRISIDKDINIKKSFVDELIFWRKIISSHVKRYKCFGTF